jgi:hypothetical protein
LETPAPRQGMAEDASIPMQAEAGKAEGRLAQGHSTPARPLADEITSTLESLGYAHIESPISIEDYESLATRIGTITLRSDIQIDANRDLMQKQTRTRERPSIYSAEPLGFHTDPNADLVSWHCLEQDEIDGAVLLLDTSDIAQQFSADELGILSLVKVYAFTKNSDSEQERSTLVPLLTDCEGSYRVFYAPWLVCGPSDSESSEMLKKFSDYLRHKEATQLIRVRLKRNECLFVDNHRMLHGRGAIAEGSKRRLLRFYLTRPGFDQEQ